MSTSYQYTDAAFTSAPGAPAIDSLEDEIRASAITIALDAIVYEDGSATITFKADVQAADETILNSLVAAHLGVTLDTVHETDGGVPIVAVDPDVAGKTPTIITSNWCDRTTWYYAAEQIEDETLSTSDETTYSAVKKFWIDLREGALTQGHKIESTRVFEVRVNGAAKVPNSLDGNGGDYTLNAADGTVTFDVALDPTDVVTADYWHSDHDNAPSMWILAPSASKKLLLRTVEVQMTEDIDPGDTAVFAVYGLVDVFAPHLMTTADPPGPIPPGTKIQLQDSKYPRMANYVDEAQGAYPTIPKLGTGWRGMKGPTHIFRWPYTGHHGKPISLEASKGMELRIYLENDTPFGGSRAVASVYATSLDE